MKRFFALVLTIALICCTFASCDDVLAMILPGMANDPNRLIEKADKALTEAPYAVTFKMNLESNHKNVHDKLAVLNSEIPATIDGENMSINMSTKSGGYTIDMNMIVVDKVMYYSMTVLGKTAKAKVDMNDEQYEEFLKEYEPELAIGPDDFGELTVEIIDDKQYISCSQLTQSGTKKINDMMEENFENTGVKTELSFTGLSFTIVIADGKYESVEVIGGYDIKIDGGTYTVTCTMITEFSYDDVEAVTVPADADEYKEYDYDDLMG